MARVAAVCVAIAVAGVSCGGDDTATRPPSVPDDAGEQTRTPPAASGSGEAAGGDTPDTAADPDAADGDEVADDEEPAAAEPLDCPPADAVSAAWGRPFELDEASATTGALGLAFCPYVEMIAPGTTDQWGREPIGEFFSITMTNQDPVVADPTAERVDGLGERANWYPGAGELSVWADGRGVIVSVPFTPEGINAFVLATSLAGLALGADATRASSTPADPADAAAAAEDAAGCPDPADVGAAAGRDVVLGDGAFAQEGEGLCPYLAAGDDPYAFTVNIGLSRDDFYPIEPDEPTEEIDDVGERAIWQPGYHLLIVWTGAGRISVQVSGSDLSDDDERDVAIAIAHGLM